MNNSVLVPTELIQQKIFLIRGKKVILDDALATFYQVETKNLNKAVSRNASRFPEDFMFQLTAEEFKQLRVHLFGEKSHGGRRVLPYAFTEQGIAMLSAVLNSERAIAVSVQIMRSFVKLRDLLLSHEQLARKIKTLESKTDDHAKAIVQIIHELQKPPTVKTRKIGF